MSEEDFVDELMTSFPDWPDFVKLHRRRARRTPDMPGPRAQSRFVCDRGGGFGDWRNGDALAIADAWDHMWRFHSRQELLQPKVAFQAIEMLRTFHQGVEMQTQRLHDVSLDGDARRATADLLMMISSASKWFRAIELLMRSMGNPYHDLIAGQKGKFAELLPEVLRLRDVMEHFDEYLRGRGGKANQNAGPFRIMIATEGDIAISRATLNVVVFGGVQNEELAISTDTLRDLMRKITDVVEGVYADASEIQ